ncbi:phage tail protein [Pseudoalteromonas piscicida]|uniref:Phage tail protein n=1 Tax=Pseudoalteromonas piscicida TaxID=43662 RepID=A0A2A5JV13_PSEO7|nr:phage tail protein [Pseudoalteromonas piscicida]PCK33131.1 phage tail protein [Pseudoalteromonas piscicida]
MALEQDIANLVKSTDALTAVVDGKAQQLDLQMAAFDSRIAKKEQDVDKFIQEAMPETRYVQDIFIGGSKDYFYPVWWRFPSNSAGTSKLTIARHYSWNSDTKPFFPNRSHQAALLLELEGNAFPWDGDANFLHIKRFHERYAPTVSHVAFKLNCYAERVDSDKPIYGGGGDGSLGPWHPTLSGLYLRGGGVTYRVIKNWKGNVSFSEGTSHEPIYIGETIREENTAKWSVKPIPEQNRVAPTLSTIPYINHPYTPPTA